VQVRGQDIGVLKTPCHFGGHRYWFECPWCYRRCRMLYQMGPALKCRTCADLRYQSEHLSPKRRKIRRAMQIRERLGQMKSTIAGPFPEKPKHMRWDTYDRLRRTCQELEMTWLQDAMEFVRRHGGL
jgi:hypothetical protein